MTKWLKSGINHTEKLNGDQNVYETLRRIISNIGEKIVRDVPVKLEEWNLENFKILQSQIDESNEEGSHEGLNGVVQS
jgi:hypothetical protein